MPTDGVPAHELDKNLARIETGLVIEKDWNRQRVHGLLGASRFLQQKDSQGEQKPGEKRVFFHGFRDHWRSHKYA